MPDFRILTFVTDQAMYAEMRASFEAGGFAESAAVFDTVDNTDGNTADPYTTLNDLLATMPEPFLIVCHQDIRLEAGADVASLRREIRNADAAFPSWAVLGSAGLGLHYEQVLCVTDPWQLPKWTGPWPVEAEVLDELFLLIRPGRAELSSGLSGFHFYAADLCLSARRQGGRALVINFPILHLSNGEQGRLSAAYREARDAIQLRLSPHYRLRILVASTFEGMILSRYGLVRRFADRRKIRAVLIKVLGRRMVP